MKPKVLLDISLLGHDPSVWRGMERVGQHLFEGLRNSDQCELSCVATSHLAGASQFLASLKGAHEIDLRCNPAQLQFSRAGLRISKIVQHSIENRSLPAKAWRWSLARVAQACCAGESRLSPARLRDANIFHTPHMPFPAAVRQARHLKKFITVHDFNPLKFPDFFSGNDSKFMDNLRACLTPDNFAFCVSETVKHDILEFSKLPAERIFVTPLAADENIFYPETDPQILAACRARYGIPAGAYFLSVSAHAPHKNFSHLIHCFGRLVESGQLPDTNLVMVGPNPQRNPEARAALEKYPRAQARVILAGRVPDGDMAAICSGACAFLFPSLFEGFGMPPLEAMQCGTPVIASNTTSIPEVVGDAGVLLPPKDADAWCQAMLQITNQPCWRNELAEKSIRRARSFSWQKFIRQTLAGYQFGLKTD
jgi:glycosyltransferase involved in cell wall biosynthesis